MTHFTDFGYRKIKNAVEYTQATLNGGRSSVRELHKGRLVQSQAHLEDAHKLTEDMFEEKPSEDMFFCHIQVDFLLDSVEGFIRIAQSQEDFCDSDQDFKLKEWVSIEESLINKCDHCFAKGYGILARLKSVRRLIDVV